MYPLDLGQQLFALLLNLKKSKKIQTKPMPYCNEYALLKLGKDHFFQRLKTGISGVWGGIRGVFVVVVVDI